MRRFFLALLGLLLALGLMACEPVEGTVVGREYDDADTWTEWRSQYHTETTTVNGHTTTRQVYTGTIPVQHYDPEHYYLKVRDVEGDDHKVKVDPHTYEVAQGGDFYSEKTGTLTPASS